MRLLAPLFLLVLVCGCTSTLTKTGLDAKATENAGSASPDQVYYTGDDARYDYFMIRSGTGGRSRLYRVPVSEGAVTNRFTVTEDRTRWRSYQVPTAATTNDSMVAPK